MLFGSSISKDRDSNEAIRKVCQDVLSGLKGQTSDLALLFVSPHHREAMETMVEYIHQEFSPRILLGCTGEGIIGGSEEVERQPACCLWTANLPEIELSPFHLVFRQTPQGIGFEGWPESLKPSEQNRVFLLLGEPFSTPGPELLNYLHEQYPGVPAIGGMASGAMDYGQNRLILDDQVLDEGVVGVIMTGPFNIQTVVSQGCRPVGERFVITRSDRNIIYELSGKSALERLQQVYTGLSPQEQRLARQGLHMGFVIDEHKNQFERGDFLVRNVIGAEQESGSIAVTDLVKEGQTAQFHVRDRETASEDLNWLLATQKVQGHGESVAGALLFSCNGRGQRLFGDPHHDITAIRKQMGEIPIAGFFAQGEIGPVGRKNFLHGYTASVALFSPVNK